MAKNPYGWMWGSLGCSCCDGLGPEVCVLVYPTAASSKGVAGTIAWNNVGRVTVKDLSDASTASALTNAQTADTIQASGYTFSLPSDATITRVNTIVTLRQNSDLPEGTFVGFSGFNSDVVFAGVHYSGTMGGTWGGFDADYTLLYSGTMPPVADVNAGASLEVSFNPVSIQAGHSTQGSIDAIALQVCYRRPA